MERTVLDFVLTLLAFAAVAMGIMAILMFIADKILKR